MKVHVLVKRNHIFPKGSIWHLYEWYVYFSLFFHVSCFFIWLFLSCLVRFCQDLESTAFSFFSSPSWALLYTIFIATCPISKDLQSRNSVLFCWMPRVWLFRALWKLIFPKHYHISFLLPSTPLHSSHLLQYDSWGLLQIVSHWKEGRGLRFGHFYYSILIFLLDRERMVLLLEFISKCLFLVFSIRLWRVMRLEVIHGGVGNNTAMLIIMIIADTYLALATSKWQGWDLNSGGMAPKSTMLYLFK